MKKISIIVPIYNCEHYIDKCVNSLIEQTYSNIEIILINDGSTDNSISKCYGIANKDKRIKVYNKENGGVSSARNLGISVATGEYITFVDCDDWVDKRFCEILENGMKGNIDLSVVSYKKVDKVKEYNVDYNNTYEKKNISEAYGLIFNDRSFFGFPWNKLYKKSIINKLGSEPFKEDIYMCEDTLFNANYMKFCKEISYNRSELYLYYQRESSATKVQIINNRKLSVFKSLDLLEDIYNKYSIENIVYLYVFYLYNYYLLKVLIYNTKSNHKLKVSKIKKIYKYVLKSKKIMFLEKLKIAIRYRIPILNDKMYKLKKKIRR